MPWLSIWTTADQIVTPPTRARLDGALDCHPPGGLPRGPVSHGELPPTRPRVALVLRRACTAAPAARTGELPGQLVTSFVAKFAHAAPRTTHDVAGLQRDAAHDVAPQDRVAEEVDERQPVAGRQVRPDRVRRVEREQQRSTRPATPARPARPPAASR